MKIDIAEYPPRFEVCGGQGVITSEAVGSGLTPFAPAPRRSGSAGKHIPDPGQRDHRTHAGNPAAGCSAVSVHSCPSGQGVHHPMLYHTDLTTNKYRDSRRQAIVHRSPNPVIPMACGIAAGCKAACLTGNRAETPVRRQRANYAQFKIESKRSQILWQSK